MRKKITKFASQGAEAYRTGEAKMEYMYDAATENKQAGNELSKAMSVHDPSFQRFYADQDSAWLREQQEIQGPKRGEFEKISYYDLSSLPGLRFEGQSAYGGPRKADSKFFLPSVKDKNRRKCNQQVLFTTPLLRIRNHAIRKFPKRKIRGHVASNVARLIKKNPRHTKRILYKLCTEKEDLLVFDGEDQNHFFLMNLRYNSLIPF